MRRIRKNVSDMEIRMKSELYEKLMLHMREKVNESRK